MPTKLVIDIEDGLTGGSRSEILQKTWIMILKGVRVTEFQRGPGGKVVSEIRGIADSFAVQTDPTHEKSPGFVNSLFDDIVDKVEEDLADERLRAIGPLLDNLYTAVLEILRVLCPDRSPSEMLDFVKAVVCRVPGAEVHRTARALITSEARRRVLETVRESATKSR